MLLELVEREPCRIEGREVDRRRRPRRSLLVEEAMLGEVAIEQFGLCLRPRPAVETGYSDRVQVADPETLSRQERRRTAVVFTAISVGLLAPRLSAAIWRRSSSADERVKGAP
jgi:hypothetical protein